MKKHVRGRLAIILFFLFSCQQEYSIENLQNSAGALQKDNSGNCTTFNIYGSFTVGKIIPDSSYIEVLVNTSHTGYYNIHTDTLNGYWFNTSGNFLSTGSNSVRLKGFGIPTLSEQDNFKIIYDTSICEVNINVLSNTPPPAAYTVMGAPNACTNPVVAGNYTILNALTASNTVTLAINVTTAGSYTLSTNSTNGYSFSGAGTFQTTGPQTITLTGTGTPANAETDNFTLRGNLSSCSFSITVH